MATLVPASDTRPTHGPSAFTLIELLVVVAIIALLISILLPALGSARQQAKTVKCLAQMRQIGMASQYYAADNQDFVPGDYWPPEHDDVPEPHNLFAEVFAKYLGGRKDAAPNTIGNTGNSRDCPLAQVFARTKIFKCPSWPGGGGGNNCPAAGGGGSRGGSRGGGGGGGGAPRPDMPIQNQVLTYSINAWDFIAEKQNLGTNGYTTLPDGPGSRGIIKLAQIPRPSNIIFITEVDAQADWQFFGRHDIFNSNHLWDGADPRMCDDMRHVSGRKGTARERALVNNVYYDGHAATTRLGKIGKHSFSPYQAPPGTPTGGGGGGGRGGGVR